MYNFASADPESILLPPENGEVLQLFQTVADGGGVLAAHSEERHILAASAEALGHPIESYEDLLAARPAIAEATTIAVGAQFARATGCRFHVVHMASREGAIVVKEVQAAGIPLTAETCPQYLTLTAENEQKVGPLIKVYPPVRHQADQDALWAGLRDGYISFVGSDHAPTPSRRRCRTSPKHRRAASAWRPSRHSWSTLSHGENLAPISFGTYSQEKPRSSTVSTRRWGSILVG